MNYKEKLTVVVVTFHSSEIVESLIKQLDRSIKILIIENSKDLSLKLKLEKKYSNVEVVIPEKNIGVGAAINIGLKKSKTKYSLQLSADVIIEKNMIQFLLEAADKIKNFSIIAPRDHNHHYGNDLYVNPSEKNKLHEMNLVAGYAMLLNMEKIPETGYFDENFFLYFEEFDFCIRCKKKKLPIYLFDEAKITHKGNSSVNQKYNRQIEINRNWHYSWSKFYYFKKHYGYFYGLKKTFPNLLRSIKKCIYYIVTGNIEKFLIQKSEIQGLFCSYCLSKSFYRPKI